MTEMIKKRVWLTPKGKKKVGFNYIVTTGQGIVPKSPYIVVTGSESGKTYILETDDISQIED
jgi:hypothetical protein